MLPGIAIGAAYGLSELAFGGARDPTLAAGKQRTAVSSMLGQQLSVRFRSAMQMGMIVMAPLVVQLPAGLVVVWISNSTLVTAQMLTLNRPEVHRWLTGRDLPKFREIQDHNVFEIDGVEEPNMDGVSAAAAGDGHTTSPISGPDSASSAAVDKGGEHVPSVMGRGRDAQAVSGAGQEEEEALATMPSAAREHNGTSQSHMDAEGACTE